MQGPGCIHPGSGVSLKLQRAQELGQAQRREGRKEGGDGGAEPCQPQACRHHRSLQSQGEAGLCLLC